MAGWPSHLLLLVLEMLKGEWERSSGTSAGWVPEERRAVQSTQHHHTTLRSLSRKNIPQCDPLSPSPGLRCLETMLWEAKVRFAAFSRRRTPQKKGPTVGYSDQDAFDHDKGQKSAISGRRLHWRLSTGFFAFSPVFMCNLVRRAPQNLEKVAKNPVEKIASNPVTSCGCHGFFGPDLSFQSPSFQICW